MSRTRIARRAQAPRSKVVNIRMGQGDRSLIDHAAAIQGKNRTEFMIEAARRAAQEALLDQTLFRVDRTTYDRFVALLDAPPRPNEHLRKLMQSKAPWEK